MSQHEADRTVTDAERTLIDYVRAHAALIDAARQIPHGWKYATVSHLLLATGRLFTPGRLPAGLTKMPDQYCYENAAAAARRHGLFYTEGMAAFLMGGKMWSLAHAWCTSADGAAIDPTWDAGAGVAYLGIAFTEPPLTPIGNRSIFEDFQRSLPILRDGLDASTQADLGRPLPALR